MRLPSIYCRTWFELADGRFLLAKRLTKIQEKKAKHPYTKIEGIFNTKEETIKAMNHNAKKELTIYYDAKFGEENW